jgi:predicted  nucleic acid-binding Zn-ribbon protein
MSARPIPQTKPMPENTAHLIQETSPGPDANDEFGELRQEAGVTSGLLSMLGNALGISPARIATALGGVIPGKSKLNAMCKCGRRYKYFADEGYTEDQSVCPPCRDEAMAAQREAAMRPEKMAAQAKLREQQQSEAEKKQAERRETVELVAQTVAEILPQLQQAKKK